MGACGGFCERNLWAKQLFGAVAGSSEWVRKTVCVACLQAPALVRHAARRAPGRPAPTSGSFAQWDPDCSRHLHLVIAVNFKSNESERVLWGNNNDLIVFGCVNSNFYMIITLTWARFYLRATQVNYMLHLHSYSFIWKIEDDVKYNCLT